MFYNFIIKLLNINLISYITLWYVTNISIRTEKKINCTFPSTVSCWTKRWALSVFPAPLSPEITMHCTVRQGNCKKALSYKIQLTQKKLRGEFLRMWDSLPDLNYMLPSTGSLSQPLQKCEEGWQFSLLQYRVWNAKDFLKNHIL